MRRVHIKLGGCKNTTYSIREKGIYFVFLLKKDALRYFMV